MISPPNRASAKRSLFRNPSGSGSRHPLDRRPRFFQHSGLDPFGIGRALVRNAGDERMGQGGSTITQQLVKNTYLSPERTLQRKYAEAMLAFALEHRLSKEDIFALYCNEIYLGQRGAVAVRGVEEAAESTSARS